ncbi:MAG: polysaccharide biosynthesis protein [Kiritimatiellia bacterium]
MKHFFADSAIFLFAYLVAFLLRFDFCAPRWGWTPVLLGAIPAITIGWAALFIFGCSRLRWNLISLQEMRRFVLACLFMVGMQLLLRLILNEDAYIYFRPPMSVAIIAGAFTLLGLLSLRYLSRIQLRPIEVADLLGRDESEIHTVAVQNGFRDKTVFVTGAGGSIGSELARQIFRARPKRLILFDVSEAALYTIHLALSECVAEVDPAELIPIVGDCGDRELMRAVLTREKPDFLLHAAAYKHVPMMECNPIAAIANNALATRTLAEEAQRAGVGTFVLISTDKAIRPRSAMGISKRLAELFVRDLAEKKTTRFCAVRFGNVLGSSGSVVPRFREQIAKGGPVTVTDVRMERYFMTIAEASGLVLQAATFAKGGEIFVLNMGQPMTILALAETMIRLSGLRPHKDIPIVFSGIRPGEKLSEELGIAAAHAEQTEHARIFVGRIQQLAHENVARLLARCEAFVTDPTFNLTAETLRTLLNEEGESS